MSEVLDYIKLNMKKIPKKISTSKPEFSITKSFDNSTQYRVYKTISAKDVEILLSDTDRTTDIKERYKAAITLADYIDEFEDDFIELSEKCTVEEIEELEDLQKQLVKEIPYFVKYDKNYLWQIYYSSEDDKYFMLFPTKEGETAVLFYMIKAKLAKEDTKIFVPICKEAYKTEIATDKEISEIENYLWLFTKNWPQICEIDGEKIVISGEAKLPENLKTKYKIVLNNAEEAKKEFTLLKALFVLATETNYEYNFEPSLAEDGTLEFYYQDEIINMDNIDKFITYQTVYKNKLKENIQNLIDDSKNNLKILNENYDKMQIKYNEQKAIIEQYLNCQHSFFKKVKFFFKLNKEKNKVKVDAKKFKGVKTTKQLQKEEEEKQVEEITIESIMIKSAEEARKIVEDETVKYSLTDLIKIYNEAKKIIEEEKNVEADFKAAELKNDRLSYKVKNASQYIEEINKHKANIFDFFKFSGKNNMFALQKGSEPEVKEKKVVVPFSLEEDFAEFSVKADKVQRDIFNEEEKNAILVSQYLLPSLNSVITKKDTYVIDEQYEELKAQYEKADADELNIFGGLMENFDGIKKLNNKKHRETKRELFNVMGFDNTTTSDEFKEKIRHFANVLSEAYQKNNALYNMTIYYDNKNKGFIYGNINPLELFYKEDVNKVYKTKVASDSNIIYYTNTVFYNNFNDTLPLGMDESTAVLIKVGNNKKLSERNINIMVEKDMYNVEIRKYKLIEESFNM